MSEKFFVLNISHKEKGATKNDIYNHLTSVSQYQIPYIPIKSTSSGTTSSYVMPTSFANTSIQIALPQNIDHMTIFDMVKTVNNKLDVTLVGEQNKDNLRFEVEPATYGLKHFILGEKYEGFGK